MGTANKLYVGLVLLFLASCNVGKFIPEGEVLYNGAHLQVVKTDRVEDFKAIQNELEELLIPEPNRKFLGTRAGLYYYYKAQQKNAGPVIRWLNKKIGEKPVYLSDVDPQYVTDLLQNRMNNRGFFMATTTYRIDSTKTAARLAYSATLNAPYTMETYSLDGDSLPIYAQINQSMEETFLEKGDRFDLQVLQRERKRIDKYLKNKGYYNFNPDFLLFEADTNQYAQRKFDLFLRIKKNVPQRALIPYKVDAIKVYPNYSLSDSTTMESSETVAGIDYLQQPIFFKPKKLAPYILLKEGDLYNAKTSSLTSKRLASLGSYKFLNIRYTELDTSNLNAKTGTLLAQIYLSPLTKRALRTEVKVETKSNGFTGPGIGLTYINRNLFKGGEVLSVSGNFSYANQISRNTDANLQSISAGLKADLVFPRLIPLSVGFFKYAIPKTKIGLGGDLLKRSQLYVLNSLNTSLGYTYNSNDLTYHELNPISVNYVKLSNVSDEFQELLDNNPFLKSSFEQQFIAGLTYKFTYNEVLDNTNKNGFFISTGFDTSGNLLSLITSEKTVLGLQYAQYAKGELDIRYYFKGDKGKTLVVRMFGGLGIPYGNSNNLPYVKQFYSGGPYSVRAFQTRSLGPGSFSSSDTQSTAYFDQTGNLQLEANLEYRFPIWSYLKGAIFMDTGNIWLTKSVQLDANSTIGNENLITELETKGRFGQNWYKELGTGIGIGLRVDVQNFVIRLDLATPVQVPYLPEGHRWVAPFTSAIKENYILNLAIGYPF